MFLPGKSHGQRSLVGCSPGGPKESDMTEHAYSGGHQSMASSGHISWIETPASQVSLVAISLTFSPYPSTGPKSWVILTKEGPRIYPLRKTLARTGMKTGQLTARARLVPRRVEWVKKSTSPQFHWHFQSLILALWDLEFQDNLKAR